MPKSYLDIDISSISGSLGEVVSLIANIRQGDIPSRAFVSPAEYINRGAKGESLKVPILGTYQWGRVVKEGIMYFRDPDYFVLVQPDCYMRTGQMYLIEP